MTIIKGAIKDSIGHPLPCRLRFTLDDPLVRGATLYVPTTHTFNLPSGSLDNDGIVVAVPPSEIEAVTYTVKIESPNGDRLYDEFHALVPNQASVNFTDLVPTGIVDNQLPATIRRIALYLRGDASLADLLSPISIRGQWMPDILYDQYDVVFNGGNSYIVKPGSPTLAALPVTPEIENDRWVLLARGGEHGTRGDKGERGLDGLGTKIDGLQNAPGDEGTQLILATNKMIFTKTPVLYGPTPEVGDASGSLVTTNYLATAIRRLSSNSVFKRAVYADFATGAGVAGNGSISDRFVSVVDMPIDSVPSLTLTKDPIEGSYFQWSRPEPGLVLVSLEVSGVWNGPINLAPVIRGALVPKTYAEPPNGGYPLGPVIPVVFRGGVCRVNNTVSWLVTLKHAERFYPGVIVSDYIGPNTLQVKIDMFSCGAIGGLLGGSY